MSGAPPRAPSAERPAKSACGGSGAAACGAGRAGASVAWSAFGGSGTAACGAGRARGWVVWSAFGSSGTAAYGAGRARVWVAWSAFGGSGAAACGAGGARPGRRRPPIWGLVGAGDLDQVVIEVGVGGDGQFFSEAVAADFYAPEGNVHELGDFFGGQIHAQVGAEF